jgi:excinuclease ABC subunit B
MDKFKLVSTFKPCGDQPQAIKSLVSELNNDALSLVLLGVTGSGKTFTLANVIEDINRPTLVISHNKTLAAQLYSEFKEFFPHNAVEYFVSYYDYYQPEAYIPVTDTYIEKDASINERLDRLRLSATSSLMSRRDCLIVASVSCIYNLGSPEDYEGSVIQFAAGEDLDRDRLMQDLVSLQYERNDFDFKPKNFRVRGEFIDIYPGYQQAAFRIKIESDRISAIFVIEPMNSKILEQLDKVSLFPAKHFMIKESQMDNALISIEQELNSRLKELKSAGKILEAHRLESRTKYDMEMLKETGYCHGVENYSRHLSARPAGSRPYCLIDYFPKDFLLVIDESHVTVPQIRGMYEGDKSRKQTLVEYGFRLPSCLDNRPLKFDEFLSLLNQNIYVSATPADFELKASKGKIIEQIIRPTGLIDPQILVRPTIGQVDDLMNEIKQRAKKSERVLVTTLTKRMAEDLSTFLKEEGISVTYLHSEIDTIGRSQILRDLRKKKYDCIVGINLLREGLDLPEVSLVAILDADKEGFLRSQTSLIQTAGRAARHINATVIMYADKLTGAIEGTIKESNRRRKKQVEFNRKNKITPRTITKAIVDGIEKEYEASQLVREMTELSSKEFEIEMLVAELEQEMELAARNLQFEHAAQLRDKISELKTKLEVKA